jgi:endonuclease YncB( thermonuclease family)
MIVLALCLVAALALSCCTQSEAQFCPSPVAVDGDALRCPDGMRVRLDDYDAPEIGHARCDRELRLALDARRELQPPMVGSKRSTPALASRSSG